MPLKNLILLVLQENNYFQIMYNQWQEIVTKITLTHTQIYIFRSLGAFILHKLV